MREKRHIMPAFWAVITILLLMCASIAVFNFTPIKAETSVTVTVQTDGNGTVASGENVSESTANNSITVQANSGETVTLKATPVDNYVFEYWYTTESTPLSYDEEYSYTVPEEPTTVHAKFIETFSDVKASATGSWTTQDSGKSYSVNSGDAYTLESEQQFFLNLEYVGEKWFSYTYNLSITSDATYGFGYQLIYVDGVKYQEINSKKSLSGTVTLKALGDGYHKIEITFQAPEYSAYVAKATSLSFTINNITFQDDKDVATTTAKIHWEERLGEVYYLPGILNTMYTGDDYIIKYGKKIASQDKDNITVPVNMPVAIAAKPFDSVTSTIDPSQQTGVKFDGLHYGERFGTSGKSTVHHFNAEGKLMDSALTYDTLNVDMREIAVMPNVTVTKTVDGLPQDEEEIQDGGTVELSYESSNSLLVAIKHYEGAQNKFTATDNGVDVKLEEIEGKTGFTLGNVNVNKTVVITPQYGEQYYILPFTFNVSIKLKEGIDKILSQASNEVTITDDDANPWFFDPGYNDEDNYAFSSANTGRKSDNYTVYQIGFTMKGNGAFSLEFYLDGNNKYIFAGYKEGAQKITPQSGDKFTSKDIAQTKGFQNVATNLAMSQTDIKYTGEKTYKAPQIMDNDHVKAIDGKDGWYSFTYSITDNENSSKTIWFACGVGNGYNSEYSRLTVRNVAFFTGTSYVDWEVKGADSDGVLADITVKKGDADAETGKTDAGTTLVFEAKPQDGRHFYGWKSVTGKLKSESEGKASAPDTITDSDIEWAEDSAKFVSYETTYRCIVGSGFTKVVAVIDKAGTYAVRSGNGFYKPNEMEKAFSAASSADDKNVIVVDNAELTGITVPQDVNLIIPFDRKGSYYAMGTKETAQERVSWATDGEYASSPYKDPIYTITLKGANEVNGTLMVGGVLYYPEQCAQGLTSGYYSQLILEEGATLNVNQNGHLDVYGRVTGKGSIDVKSGGKLTQPFMILDYNGGTNTQSMFNKGVTPFKMYSMVNIQCEGGFTINHGAELWGHACLYFLSSITTIDTPFISYVSRHDGGSDYFQNDALIVLNDEAKAHIVYDDTNYTDTKDGHHKRVEMGESNNVQDVGFTKMTITGNAYADFMQFPLGINTKQVYFSVPYNFDITLESGNFDILHPYKMMPGATLTVAEGATLTVRSPSGNNPNGLYVYDSFADPKVAKRAYPTSEQLTNAGYNSYASLIVNGNLVVKSGADFVGTVQTTGKNGTIKIEQGAILEKDLFDGTSTEYSCSYTSYSLKAQVYDAVRGKLMPLKDNRTYKSVEYTTEWTLPGIAFQVESGDTKHNSSQHTTKEVVTTDAKLKGGAFAAEHTDHIFDWTKRDGDPKPDDSTRVQTLERQCEEIGCAETHEKHLLLLPTLTAEYKGRAFDKDEIKELIANFYGEGYDEGYFDFGSFEIGNIFNVGEYKPNITLTEDTLFYGEEAYAQSGEVKISITQHALSDGDVSASGDLTYKGVEYTDEEIEQIVSVKIGDVTMPKSDYTMTIEGDKKNVGSFNVIIAAATEGDVQNVTGSITISIRIGQVEASISADPKSTPKGEDATTLTATLRGFFEGDEQRVRDLLVFTLKIGDQVVESIRDLETGTELTIVVAFKSDLTDDDNKLLGNYSITTTEGVYTIADSVYKGIVFEGASFAYDGTPKELSASNLPEGVHASYAYRRNEQLIAKSSVKAVGDYTVTATFSKDGYNPLVMTVSLTITRKVINVTVTKQEIVYNGKEQTFNTDGKWYTADGEFVEGDEVVLSASASGTNAASYSVTVSVTGENADNYDIRFSGTSDAFVITKAKLTVSAENKSSVYGDEIEDFTAEIVGAADGDDIKANVKLSASEKDSDKAVTLTAKTAVGEYSIIVKLEGNFGVNYDIELKNGVYTITKRNIKIEVEQQTDVYGYKKQYRLDGSKWKVADGTFAKDESKDDLNVTLSIGEITKAGEYDIMANYQNDNYAVEFTSAKFVVEKKDIADVEEAFITLNAGNTSAENGTLRVSYSGSPIPLVARLFVNEDGIVEIEGGAVPSIASVTEIGEFTVTVSVQSDNYKGSETFTLIVTNENGYTQGLVDTLAKLSGLKAKLGSEFKDDDFATVKEIYDTLSQMSDEDKAACASELLEYEDIIDRWNEAIAIDTAEIETAKTIADSFIDYLYKAIAAAGALLGMAYVAIKGVKRI